MKGFIKGCLIAALILVGAGLALTISGVILTDADQVARSVDSVTGGKVNFDIDPSDGRFEIAFGDYSTADLRNAVGKILDHRIYDVADDGDIYDEAQELFSGDVESQCFPGADVQRLDLDAGGCSIQVLLSEDANYYVAAKSIEKLQAYVSGETLYVKSTRSGKLSGEEIKNAVILLYVPEETYLKEDMMVEPEMTFTVPENAYFCLGDNRNESRDARYWDNTYVYRDKILAKVLVRHWPGFKKIE